jgi:glycosyltransferase involved in cell wall biosynthesis
MSPGLRRLSRRAEQAPGPSRTVAALIELARDGAAPLASGLTPADAPATIATVIPSFRRGSGGHATIVHLLKGLRALGHSVSVWLEDCEGRHANESKALIKRSFAEFFGADELELHTDFDGWRGADVVLATGWQTVAPVLMLGGTHARAYLVQDHEPDFYPASAESMWAAQTYRQGLHCIAASPWLAELLRTRYGAEATHFDLAVEHAVYAPREELRRDDLVVFYARSATPRRAVPLGLAALDELARTRPELEICLYGEAETARAATAHRQLGILDAARLTELYSQATVGLTLSVTNPSLVSLEMMACGLPCVELASEAMLSTFGEQGAPVLADPDPVSLCEALVALLDDAERRRQLAAAGLALMRERTWSRAASQVSIGIDLALRQATGRR